MKQTPLQKRAERSNRNRSSIDLNLVALIDIFTILIFFLLSNSGVETLPTSKTVKLPESTAQKAPADTVVVLINQNEIVVEGRRIVAVADVIDQEADLIAALKEELDIQANRQTIRAETAAKNKAITIMGDRDIPYRLLRKVMVTCARANFTDISFAVQMKAGES
jgi:biopolymer transport protein TolR